MSHIQELIPPRPAPMCCGQAAEHFRIVGIAVITLWLLLAAALIFAMIEGWDWDKFQRYGPRYIDGLITTITLVGSSIILGAILSVPIAFAACRKTASSARCLCLCLCLPQHATAWRSFLIYYGLGSFRPGWKPSISGGFSAKPGIVGSCR